MLAPYRGAFADARWLRPELLHVTVRFLGWLPEAVVPDLARSVSEAARLASAIDLATGPGGGNGRGGVAWLGMTTGGSAVRRLCGILDERLPAPALAAIDRRVPPSAHVTVARRTSRELVDALRAQTLGATTLAWTADRLVLFRSFTGTPDGSRYEPLVEARLGGRAAA
jgi:2'-5' RNA ligase